MDESPDRPSRAARLVVALAFCFEILSVLVQLVLVWQVVDYRQHMGCGEQCAFAAMGLMVMLLGGLYVVVPGTIGALFLGSRAYKRRRQDGGQLLALASHGAPLALSVVLIYLVATSDKPLPTPVVSPPPVATLSPPEQEVAGYVWATDNGMSRESDCTTGTEAFIAGCKRNVRQHSGRIVLH